MDEAVYAAAEGKPLSLDQLRAQAVKFKTLAQTEFAQARGMLHLYVNCLGS